MFEPKTRQGEIIPPTPAEMADFTKIMDAGVPQSITANEADTEKLTKGTFFRIRKALTFQDTAGIPGFPGDS